MEEHDRIADACLEVAHLRIEHTDNAPAQVHWVDLWIRDLWVGHR